MPIFLPNLKDKLTDAFCKLQQSVYFDNTDLHLRAQMAVFRKRDAETVIEDLNSKIDRLHLKSGKDYFEALYDKIETRFYPKKVDTEIDRDDIPNNFITNAIYKDNCTISRLSIFCNIPVELHIIAVLWIMEFGYRLDKKLSKDCLGNRLLLTNGKVASGRSLFKPYIRQYQKWWSGGINAAKDLLDKKEDVTIVNFDLKEFFLRVEFDFKALEEKLFSRNKKGLTDPIHVIFKEIHRRYHEKLKELEYPGIGDNSNGQEKYALPIGLLSSFVLANWHLYPLDRRINKEIIPSYYGRYVDDFMIVLKGRLIDSISATERSRLSADFIKRGISDEGSKKDFFLRYFMAKYFKSFFSPERQNDAGAKESILYRLRLPAFKNLVLQDEKIFIYQFDAEMSPGLISKFVEEQRERSSEFRFLSDQEDDGFDEFEEHIFEDNFESDDLTKARFKKIEDNKFRLSVYLAKMIQRKIERGNDYKPDEIGKIERYFKGTYVIKHYNFWEKLFTLYLVSDRRDLFTELIRHINRVLSKVRFSKNIGPHSKRVLDDLRRHLKYSVEMALGLDPNFLNVAALKGVTDADASTFRKVSFVRKQFVVYPLLHLAKGIRDGVDSLIDYKTLDSLGNLSDFQIPEPEFSPHRVKFYEVVLFMFARTCSREVRKVSTNYKRKTMDTFNSGPLLDSSFELFCDINGIRPTKRATLKLEYFSKLPIDTERQDVGLSELVLKNGGTSKDICRVALVNKYIPFTDFEASLMGRPAIDKERNETYNWILDQVSKVKGVDIFAMPELALPHPFLLRYVRFSAKFSTAFVSGIEHIRAKNLGFNFVLTCLPVNVKGDKDAIPILRLKNHYSPEEEEWIRGKHMVVPKPKPYRYDLIIWRGFYLSTYYCYELANIHHRALFLSKVDLICAPVWNPDTHYYDSIIDSASRDMHCYMIQVNTSQYGDTRVTRPTDHIRKDKAKVKGGTVKGYDVTLLVSDLEIKKLREFQSLEYSAQKQLNAEKKSFKPTPPDFSIENVAVRMSNGRFGEEES